MFSCLLLYNWNHTIFILLWHICFNSCYVDKQSYCSFLFQNSFPFYGFSKFIAFPVDRYLGVLAVLGYYKLCCYGNSYFYLLFNLTSIPTVFWTEGRRMRRERTWANSSMQLLLLISYRPKFGQMAIFICREYWEM